MAAKRNLPKHIVQSPTPRGTRYRVLRRAERTELPSYHLVATFYTEADAARYLELVDG